VDKVRGAPTFQNRSFRRCLGMPVLSPKLLSPRLLSPRMQGLISPRSEQGEPGGQLSEPLLQGSTQAHVADEEPTPGELCPCCIAPREGESGQPRAAPLPPAPALRRAWARPALTGGSHAPRTQGSARPRRRSLRAPQTS